MHKKSIILIIICVLIVMSGTCFPSERPLGKIRTRQDVIDKVFVGRTLDPIEGIWYIDQDSEVAIVKTSFLKLECNKNNEYDYVMIIIKFSFGGFFSNADSEVAYLLKKSDLQNIYKPKPILGSVPSRADWRLLSPTLLQHGGDGDIFMRIYPVSQ